MPAALAEYAAAEKGPHAWMLGRFIVPASRVGELLAAVRDGGVPPLSAIVDAGSDPRTWLSALQGALSQLAALRSGEPRVGIDALEIALAPLQTQRETYDAPIGQLAAALEQAGLGDLPAFVELPRDARWAGEVRGAMFALARHRLGAKLRCGGVTPQAFPGAADVAAFLTAAASERVPVKATAGLHHPLYHRDETIGVMMHGFLNLLAASASARAGADAAAVQAILESEDAERLRPGAAGLSAETLRDVREHAFVSYGSCSFTEPADDLRALGVL